MSWPASFIQALSAPVLTPYYRLEFLPMTTSVNASGVVFSNREGEGRAVIAGTTTWSGTLTPSPCEITLGGFDVTLAGSLLGVLDDLPAGAIAVLYCHPTGDEGAAEPWAVGPLEGITRTGLQEVFTLRFGDLIAALSTRQTLDTSATKAEESEAALFWRLSRAAVVFSSGSSVDMTSSGTLTAASGAGNFDYFEQENGQRGLLKVVNSNGDETLLEWDSKASSTELTMSGTGPQRGSSTITWSNLLGSNRGKVFPMARLTDHPGVIFLKIVASTGTAGSTGIYDTLPASWGVDPGGQLFAFVDVNNVSAWIQEVMVPTTGNYLDGEWDLVSDSRQDSALRWLVTLLLEAGIFPAMRHGMLTLRALQDLNPATTRQPHGLKTTGLTITDDDIIEVVQLQVPASEQQSVARTSQVITAEVYDSSTPTREGDPKTYEDTYSGWRAGRLPAMVLRDHDLSKVLFGRTGASSEQAVAEGDAARMLCWDALPWEKLSLKVHSRFAQLCKGDIIYLTTNLIYGGLLETRYGYDAQPMMVTSVRVSLDAPDGPTAWVDLVTVTVPSES